MVGKLKARHGVRSLRACLYASSILCLAASFPALAQSVVVPAPEPFRNVDDHGVDLVTGTYNMELLEGDIGRGDNRLALIRYGGQSGWRDNFSGELRRTLVGTVDTAVITFGKISEKFTKQGAVWVSAKANGATLVESGSSYTYKAADGTTIVYTTPEALGGGDPIDVPSSFCTTATGASCAVPTSLTMQSGQKLTMTWAVPQVCRWPAGQPRTIDNTTCTTVYRLSDIRSSTSYAIKLKYQSDSTGVNTGAPSAWFKRSSAKFIDLSQAYCDPAANNCDAVPGSWPLVTYTNPTATTTNLTRETGATYVLTTNTAGLLVGVRRPGAAADTTVITRGTDGRVTSITENGETKSYNWTGTTTTSVTATTGAGEVDIVTSVPATGEPATIVNATANTTSYIYDANNRKTRETRPEGDYTNWTYDARGNVTETRDVAKPGSGIADIVTTANYDATCANALTCNKPSFVIDAKGNRSDFTYDATHGGVTRTQLAAPTTGAARPQVDYVYTSLYPQVLNASNVLVNAATPEVRVTQITACATAATCAGTANETKATYAYANPNLLVSSVTVASGDGAISATTAYTYDAADNVKTVDGPLPGTADTTTLFYDASNRRKGAIGPDPDGVGARKRQAQRLTYDGEDRVIKVEGGSTAGNTDADLTAMTVAQTIDIAFDTNSNKIRETVSSGGTVYAVTQYSYDVDNRLTCTAQRLNPLTYGALPASACTASTVSPAFGPDRITQSFYDTNARVAKVQTAVGTLDAADEVSYTYTANSKVGSVTDGQSNRTQYTYDGFDRVAKTSFPSPTAGAGTASATDYEAYTYDPNGNVTQRRLRDASLIGLSYDALNRNIFVDLNGVGVDQDITNTYDMLGRLTQTIDTSFHKTAYVYDALGRATGETNTYGALKTSTYDAAGRRAKLAWPDGFFVNYDYSVTGEMTAIRENGATTGTGVLGTYAYDDLGRMTSLTRGNGVVTSYTFDPVSRLASLAHDLTGTAQDVSTSFTYNPASQIVTTTRNNDAYAWAGHYNVDRPYTVNGLNQLTTAGATALGYDAKGNLNASGATTYTYGQRNQMYGAPGYTLFYDPLNRVDLSYTNATATGTRFDYDHDHLATETAYPGGTMLRRYVFGPGADAPLVWYEGATTTDKRWLIPDERGSIVAVTGSTGSAIAVNAYDEYGIPSSTSLANQGRFGYTGQAFLPEIGLYYYKARLYSPTLGRFMQTDPIGYGDGVNWYNYVGGDPVNFRDPSGLDPDIVVTGVCGSGYHYEEGKGINGCVPDTVIQVSGHGTPYDSGRTGGGRGPAPPRPPCSATNSALANFRRYASTTATWTGRASNVAAIAGVLPTPATPALEAGAAGLRAASAIATGLQLTADVLIGIDVGDFSSLRADLSIAVASFVPAGNIASNTVNGIGGSFVDAVSKKGLERFADAAYQESVNAIPTICY